MGMAKNISNYLNSINDKRIANALQKVINQITPIGLDTAITAHAGGGQADARVLRQDCAYHDVTTVASANDSVALPAAMVGEVHFVMNSDSAESMQVYAPTPGTIDSVATGTGVPIPAGTGRLFVCLVQGNYVSLSGTPASLLATLGAVTASATEINYNDITTLGTVQASKTVTADANKVVTWTGVPAANGLLNIQATATSTTPGSVRAILGSVVQAATTTTGTVAGIRGIVTATTAMSNYAYGTQGKIVLDSVVVTAGSNHVCGVMAQISGSGATFTNGHIAALICSGQTLPAGVSNMIYCESGGNKINAVLESNVAADYFMSINNFEACGIVAAGASTAGANIKKIKILVDGVAKYFICADDWS